MSLIDELNQLCLEIYGKEYHEVFGFFEYNEEDLLQQKQFLLQKKKFKEKAQKAKTETKRGFLKIWRELWDTWIEAQPILRELYALAAVSQLLKHVKIYRGVEEDIRIHVCAIMPSGIGKSDANDILARFAKIASLKYYSVDRYNDAVLTGSIDKQAIEHNIKHKLKKGDEGWIDPHCPSILEVNDFIVYDEGENILKPTQATEGAQRILQKAMNRYKSEGNKITNTLVGYKVESYPLCSVVITSYYLDDFKETLLHRGLLQRMIVYIQEECEERRSRIINRIIDEIPKFDGDVRDAVAIVEAKNKKTKKLLKELRKEVQKLREAHKKTKYVYMKKGAEKVLLDCIEELRNIMPFLIGQKQIWESMVSRLAINILKVSAIYALLDYRNYMTAEDAEEAAKLLMETMKTVAFFLKENIKTEVDLKTMNILAALRKKALGERKTFEGWVDLLVKEFNFSREKAVMVVKNLEENQRFKVVKTDKSKLLILT